MAREIARAGGRLPQAIAETGTLPYLTWRTGPTEITAQSGRRTCRSACFRPRTPWLRWGRSASCFPRCGRASTCSMPRSLTRARSFTRRSCWSMPPPSTRGASTLRRRHHAERAPPHRGGGRGADGRPPWLGLPRAPLRAGHPLRGRSRCRRAVRRRARAKLTASGLWSEPVDLGHRYVTEDVALGLTLPVVRRAHRGGGLAGHERSPARLRGAVGPATRRSRTGPGSPGLGRASPPRGSGPPARRLDLALLAPRESITRRGTSTAPFRRSRAFRRASLPPPGEGLRRRSRRSNGGASGLRPAAVRIFASLAGVVVPVVVVHGAHVAAQRDLVRPHRTP